jgi:hypothetical protein
VWVLAVQRIALTVLLQIILKSHNGTVSVFRVGDRGKRFLSNTVKHSVTSYLNSLNLQAIKLSNIRVLETVG